MTDYTVYGPSGQYLCSLNRFLVRSQGVDDAGVEALKTSHQLRWIILEGAREICRIGPDKPLIPETEKKLKLKLLASMLTALEFEQQRLWKFTLDANYHRFFDLPGCTCPKLDNAERVGSPHKIHNVDCPIHGAA